MVVTTVLLTQEQHDAFKRVATAEHRTMSGQVRVWIEAADAELATFDDEREAA